MCMFLLSYPIEQFVTFEIVTNVTGCTDIVYYSSLF